MKSLNEDIKNGQFKQMYLLYGEETYLKRQYRDRLRDAMMPDNASMNYARYQGKGVDPKGLIDLCETVPFLADSRLILVEDSGFFKSPVPELASYLQELPDTVHLLFVEDEIDKRGKMYKAVTGNGRGVEFARQDEGTLSRWVQQRLKKEGLQVSGDTTRYLLAVCGTDMQMLQNELEKIYSYKEGQGNLLPADIDAVCVPQLTKRIFDMVHAVAAGQQEKSLRYYRDLLASKESSIRILAMLVREFRLLYIVKDLVGQRMSDKEIASRAGLHPFLVRKYKEQQQAFDRETLHAILEDAADTEERIKTGRITDVLGVELFLVRHSAQEE